jgi:hypothetical protein
MNAHTPGPWMVGELHSGSALVDIKARGLVVTRTLVLSADPDCDPLIEAEANARLIAAAPDLLAALKGLLEEAGSLASLVDQEFNVGDDPSNADGDAFKCAEAAIAKAEGRS